MRISYLTTTASLILIALPVLWAQSANEKLNAALYVASVQGNLADVETLIKGGADVNAKTQGITPLIIASYRGHVSVVQQLIKHGASLNITAFVDGRMEDKGHGTAIVFAIHKNQLDVVRYLIEQGAAKGEQGEKALRYAVRLDLIEMVSSLIKAGVHINAADKNGMSPLLIAAENCYPDMVSFLLGKNADPKQTNATGEDALTLAKKQKFGDEYTEGKRRQDTVITILEKRH